MMKKRFWQVVFWFKGVWIGIKGMTRTQLGSRVYYDGEWWFISNWANGPLMNLAKGSRWGHAPGYLEHVPKKQTKPSHSIAEFVHRFRAMYRWYMGYWWAIDVNKRIMK